MKRIYIILYFVISEEFGSSYSTVRQMSAKYRISQVTIYVNQMFTDYCCGSNFHFLKCFFTVNVLKFRENIKRALK